VPNTYFSFLLRLWRTNDPPESEWRVSLEDPHSRELRSFTSPQACWEYLQAVMTATEPSSPSQPFQDKDFTHEHSPD